MRYNGPAESCIHLMCKSWWVCAYANTDDTITTIKTVDISNTSHKLLPISSSEITNLTPHTVSLRHHKTLESPLDSKEIQPVHPKGNQLNIPWKDWCWSWNSNTLATWCEELTHWKRPWCWKRLKAGGEGDERGWDVWMASPTQWTWVWASLRSWWWTGKPGVLQSMGLQTVGLDWVIDLNWTELNLFFRDHESDTVHWKLSVSTLYTLLFHRALFSSQCL